jgi:hypothetical protein
LTICQLFQTKNWDGGRGIEKIWDIDTTTFKGKRLRGELLVQLKDRAGLKYKEIAEMDIFTRLSFTSLGSIYRNIKKAHLKKVE